MWICTHVQAEARGHILRVSSTFPWSLRQASQWPETHDSLRLTGHKVPGTCLSLPPWCWDYIYSNTPRFFTELLRIELGSLCLLCTSLQLWIRIFLKCIFNYVYMCMNANAHRGERCWISWELELQVVVSHPTWALGTRLGSFWMSNTFTLSLSSLDSCAKILNALWLLEWLGSLKKAMSFARVTLPTIIKGLFPGFASSSLHCPEWC